MSIPQNVMASRAYAGLYLWFKGRNLYLETSAAYAFAKALVRREFVYGQVVNPADPQLMEGGSTCPICQVRCEELLLQVNRQRMGNYVLPVVCLSKAACNAIILLFHARYSLYTCCLQARLQMWHILKSFWESMWCRIR